MRILLFCLVAVACGCTGASGPTMTAEDVESVRKAKEAAAALDANTAKMKGDGGAEDMRLLVEGADKAAGVYRR